MYELIEADSPQEAAAKSKFSFGQKVVVTGLTVSSAGNGKYTVIPVISVEDPSKKEKS